MNTIKKIGVSASLLLASGLASAAVYNLSDVNVVAPGVSGPFNDTFHFTIDASVIGSFDFFAVLSNEATDVSSFSNIVLNDASGVLVSGSVGNALGFSIGRLDLPGFLAAGDYSFVVSGDSLSATSEYAVSYSFDLPAVSPVPEPSLIALMLGGLGLVGFMAARRKKA